MKKITPIFKGSIVNGFIKFSGAVKEHINIWLGSFKTGTEVDVTVRKHTKKRTLPQNAYYWGVVIPLLSEYFGYESEEMHDEMKLKFYPLPSKLDPKKIIGGSTTRLSVDDFLNGEGSYVNRIRRWAAMEYGIHIPDPSKAE